MILLEYLLPIRKTQPKFLGGHLDYFSIAQNINWQPFAGVLFHDFFNSGIEGHLSTA
jgi:hypothetical protein